MNEMNSGERTYRVDHETLRGDLPILVLLVLDVAFGIVTLSRMPARVPTHWGISGKPDAWGPAWMNGLLLPGIAIATYSLLLLLPLIDPERRKYALFSDTAQFFRGVVTLFLVGMHVVVTLVSLGHAIDMSFVVRLATPLLLIALGNRFGRLRHNYFFGIRVPWTLASEEVWTRTHRMAGRVWVLGGLLALPCALLPPGPGDTVLGSIVAVMVLVPVVYSWWLFRALERGPGRNLIP